MSQTYVYLLRGPSGGEELYFVRGRDGWSEADREAKKILGMAYVKRVGTLNRENLLDLAVRVLFE